jgi:hypothetical protein
MIEHRNLVAKAARIPGSSSVGFHRPARDFLSGYAVLGSDGLREQPVAHRRTHPERAREERIATQAHH